MYKKIFYLSLGTGIFSAVASLIYCRVYYFAFEVDFTKVVNVASLIGINLFCGLVAGILFWMMVKQFGNRADIFFNILFVACCFGSIILPFSVNLPLSVDHPELFPGLVVPMHFFPAMGWFALRPFLKDLG